MGEGVVYLQEGQGTLTAKMNLSKDLKEVVSQHTLWVSERKTFQGEGIVDAPALSWECN